MEEIKNTLKDCRAFNQRSFETTKALIKENFKNGECEELVLPDEAHPWNILHAVIDQYYERESEIARVISMAHYDMEIANKKIANCMQWDDLFMKMQVEVSSLKEENAQMKENHHNEKPYRISKPLVDLLAINRSEDWAEYMNELLDLLIMAIDYIGGETLSGGLYRVRTLHKFFVELGKEMDR